MLLLFFSKYASAQRTLVTQPPHWNAAIFQNIAHIYMCRQHTLHARTRRIHQHNQSQDGHSRNKFFLLDQIRFRFRLNSSGKPPPLRFHPSKSTLPLHCTGNALDKSSKKQQQIPRNSNFQTICIHNQLSHAPIFICDFSLDYHRFSGVQSSFFTTVAPFTNLIFQLHRKQPIIFTFLSIFIHSCIFFSLCSSTLRRLRR